MQEVETWDINKRVKAWNMKSGKMGNKLVRYNGGGWVLLRCVLDPVIASIVKGNINILGYHHREVFEGEEFPIPVAEELLANIRLWEEDLSDITEDMVREELGLKSTAELAETYFDEDEDDRFYAKKKKNLLSSAERRKKKNSYQDSFDDDFESGNDGWYGGGGGDHDLFSNSGQMKDDNVGYFDFANAFDSDFVPLDDDGTWSDGNDVGVVPKQSPTLDSSEANFSKSNSSPAEFMKDYSSMSEDGYNDDFSDDLLAWWDDDAPQDEVDGNTYKDSDAQEDRNHSDDDDDGNQKEQRIEVVSGPFKDFEGIIIKDAAKDQGVAGTSLVRAEIDVFGKPTIADIEASDFRLLD